MSIADELHAKARLQLIAALGLEDNPAHEATDLMLLAAVRINRLQDWREKVKAAVCLLNSSI